MTSKLRKRLIDVLRIAICVVALWIVARGVTLNDRVVLADGSILVGLAERGDGTVHVSGTDGAARTVPLAEVALDQRGDPQIVYGLRSAWGNSSKWILLLAVFIHLPVGFVQGVRLRMLLRVQAIYVTLWDCVKLSFAGNFLNFATPLGSNAGDVFKAYFVTTHTSQKTEAATTIALDRAIGLGTLLGCVALITLIASGDERLATVRPYILTVLAAGAVGALAYLSPVVRRWTNLEGRLAHRPVFAHLQRIDQTIRLLAGNKAALVSAVFVTVVLQVLAVSAYFAVAVALNLDAHLGNMLAYFAYFYSGAVVQALPGPPQGLGTVELVYRYFLAPYGSPSQIVSLAFLARLVVLTCALPGLLVTLTGSYRPRKALASSETAAKNPPAPADGGGDPAAA